MQANKDLKKFYDGVYEKGEEKHYTPKISLSDKQLTNEHREVIDVMSWEGKSVLDVGCGTGRVCFEIAKLGAKRVVGIDFSDAAIEKARARPPLDNLEFLVEDIADHSARYDVIVSVGALEHMDDPLGMLERFKEHLNEDGVIVVTCPNWTNPRGYMLQTLLRLFDAPITLADIHSLTPVEFEAWVEILDMDLSWHTFDHDWAHGERLITDFERRIPNVLRDAGLPNDEGKVANFIEWIREHVLPLDHESKFSGATGLYLLTQKKT